MTDQTTTAFIPAGARVFLRRRFEELIGFVLLLLGAADLVALLSAKQNDKSFNVATDEPVRNLLGAPGAYVADLTLQSLGLAAFMLAVALGIWGLQLMRHRSATRWWLRLILLPASLLAASVGLGLLPWSGDWPFQISLGGAVGQLLFGGGALKGLVGLGTIPLWAPQAACLVLALPL